MAMKLPKMHCDRAENVGTEFDQFEETMREYQVPTWKQYVRMLRYNMDERAQEHVKTLWTDEPASSLYQAANAQNAPDALWETVYRFIRADAFSRLNVVEARPGDTVRKQWKAVSFPACVNRDYTWKEVEDVMGQIRIQLFWR